MGQKIICIGECMVEFSPQGSAGVYHRGFAGDTFNTAWYLRQLVSESSSISYYTAIGDDIYSKEFLIYLEQIGIDSSSIEVRPNRSMGLYIVHLNRGERSFSYWRNESAARCLADDLVILDTLIAECEVVYFSGITVAILSDLARSNLFGALERAKARGQTIAFDPNLRPRLWSNIASMLIETTKFAELADIVLPSFEDEATHYKDKDSEATIRRYSGYGADVVVVKNSIAEIVAASGKAKVHVQPETVLSAIDTTAAGDSFNAGFLASWLDGKPLNDAVCNGAQVSKKVISGRGALVPLFSNGRTETDCGKNK